MNAKDTIRQVREEQTPSPEPPETAAASPPTRSAPPAALPATPPATGGNWEPWMQRVLDMCRKRFVEERAAGFTPPGSNTAYPPVPREEAEARWLKAEPRFRYLIQNDPEMREKFGTSPAVPGAPKSAASASAEPPVPEPPIEEPPAEPPPTA